MCAKPISIGAFTYKNYTRGFQYNAYFIDEDKKKTYYIFVGPQKKGQYNIIQLVLRTKKKKISLLSKGTCDPVAQQFHAEFRRGATGGRCLETSLSRTISYQSHYSRGQDALLGRPKLEQQLSQSVLRPTRRRRGA